MGGVLRALARVPAWTWVSALLGLILIALDLVSRPVSVPGATALTSATAVLRRVGAGTDDPGESRAVRLPHIWDDESPPWEGDAQYHLGWPQGLEPTSQRIGLYLPRVGARFRVLLNDEVFVEQNWHTVDYVDTSVVPWFFEVPEKLLLPNPKDNRLVVEVRGQLLRKSGLSAPVLGPYELVQQRYERVYWWQVYATWMVAACSLMLGVLTGLLWLHGRERVFGLLAAACFSWSVRLGLTPLVDPRMPFELWFYLHKLSFTAYCGFLYLFLWDLFDVRARWARHLVVALLCIGPFWLAATTWVANYNLYRIWTGTIAAVSVVTLTMMFMRARWGLDNNQRLMVVVGLVTLITGVRDFGVVQLGWPGDGDLRWMTPGSLVFMLTLAWVMVQRATSYVQKVGELNRDLELKVREKESELRLAFEQIREAERTQVLESERRRLTRDMHDGLGSQLVQTLNMVRSGADVDARQVESMINHALEELRMTLDSLEPMEGDLPAILGTLRRRIAPALEAARIELEWEVEEVPAITDRGARLESRGVMHLFRCLQEVFANIIKHARASRVTVRTWTQEGRPMLSVTDNGVGLGPGYREGGRGLSNIRLRATEIGAHVRFGDAAPGTTVEFAFSATATTGMDMSSP